MFFKLKPCGILKPMKLKVTLILAIVFSLIGAGVATYLVYFTPKAQADTVASAVMQAASAQDEVTFKQYGSPDGAADFYADAAQRNYLERSDTQSDDETIYYFLYTFTDELSPKQARIGVSGKKVTSLATGDKLGATPEKDSKEVIEEAVQSFCLSRDDLAYLDSTRLYAKTFRGATMFFAGGDSLVYAEPEGSVDLLNRMAKFYDATSSKDYYFLVRGYLSSDNLTHEQRQEVIQNRATKIMSDLVARGIPEDRIKIGNPVSYEADQTTAENERYVLIDVVNNCNK